MYGRARRINALKTLGIVTVVIIVLALVVSITLGIIKKRNTKDNFQTLKKYMVQKGFDCELIENPGEACKYNKEGILARFVRYEDGFSYNVNTDAYYVELKYTKDEKKFVFRTTDQALKGYKNKIYKCTYNGSVLDGFKECKDEDDHLLDSKAYQGEIIGFMEDLGKILQASKYNTDKLLKDYQWVE